MRGAPLSQGGREEERFRRARLDMVESQLAARGIHDERVLAAMRRVPRHLFVPEVFREEAYTDKALPIGQGQTISQPYMVAASLQALGPQGGEKVLEIGAGSGYVTALLAELAAKVRAIERLPELSRGARDRLEQAGYTNFLLWTADGTYGWPEEAPFDAILAAASSPEPPQPWLEQLAPGGRLVMPLGGEEGQMLVRIARQPDGSLRRSEDLVPCVFVRLIGRFGWPQ
ncbi:MAG: protein-L-isoaspartate(D-aspartate) O-methyltransferase [Nitrospinota bacterium]